jgi:predicted NAD/FAD-binding protein
MLRSHEESLRVVVVGSGVAGLTAAYLLQQKHRVTLLEKNTYAGGHSNTVVLPDGPDAGTAIDTGFIVCNDQTYPLFLRLLARLGCPTQPSEMSFGFHSEVTGLQYAGTGWRGLFASPRNAVNPRYLAMLAEIIRFSSRARADLAAGLLRGRTIGDYLAWRGFSEHVTRSYIVPMAAAIWSATQRSIRDFPAEALIRFWANHGLLSLRNRPNWMTVAGGSHRYVKTLLSQLQMPCRLGAAIAHIRREHNGAVLTMRDGTEERYDAVVLAAHADEALRLLADPSEAERRLLGAWSYQENRTLLHTDESVMPSNRHAWASWNHVQRRGGSDDDPVAVSYHMNRLQNLSAQRSYFVTLNNGHSVRREHVLREILYTHPVYTFEAMATQDALPQLNGVRRTFFCGSYFGYGFHEDAVRSAVEVARRLGTDL